ncbi:MAG: hypothetical protein H7288_18485 [Kineosporiaceae bacterium]|nr:hypothetical protein [Aeromicrobium sp.]
MDWLVIFAMVMLSHAVSGPAEDRWPAVLDGLDAIRSQAFEEGRSDDLALVYPEGSLLLQRDKALLASYASRGVDIERMQMRLIGSHVTSVSPRRVTMDVTDQLVEARIRLSDATVRDLPRDRPTRRIVELTLTGRGWRISAVRQQ